MSARGPWVVDLYRRVLKVLLPEPFRGRYAAGMEAMFRDEWMARGRFRRVGLLVRAGLDVVWTACVERIGLGTGITQGEDGTMWSNGMGMDLRTTLRALRRAPLFTLAAVSSLGVGFGGVATVYALADHLLFDPIAGVEAPDELVEITPGTLPYPVVQDYQQGLRSVAGVAAHRVRTVALEVGNGFEPRPVGVGIVTGNYFDLLGVTPTRGRLLTPADSITGAAPVTVLAHSLWTEMGEPEDVLGTELRINGSAFRVVGVAPEGFSGLRLWTEPALWIPVEAWPRASLGRTPHVSSRTWGWIAAVARLAPGTDLATLTGEVRREAARIGQEHPENEVDPATVAVVPSRLRAADQGGGMLTPLLTALGAMALLALGAAAANVANLLVSRAIRRKRELSVRAALGAGRLRLARLVAIEGGVLVSLGAAAGLAISWVLLRVLASVSLPGGIRLDASNVAPDPAMMALAGGLLTVVVMVTALAPMLATGRVSAASASTVRSSGRGPRRTRIRALLSGAQLAVGVVLLTGTLLFGRSLVTALGVDLGFDPERLAVIELDGLLFGEDTSAGTTAVGELVRQVRQRPGIEAASWASAPPLSQGGDFETFDIVGRAWPDRRPSVEINTVGGDFFTATGIPLVAGDAAATTEGLRTPVLVVSEAMAEQYWPGESPIGTHVQIAGVELPVVAIAADTRFHGYSSDPRPTAYGVFPAPISPSIAVLARGPGVDAVLQNARDLIGSVDRRLVVAKLATGPGLIEDLLAPQRFGGGVALLFAALSLTLCVAGVYGVVAYGVAARLREFGVRLTLGAEPGRVAGEVVLRSLGPTILGLVTGALASVALTRVAARFLFGIESGDWLPAAAAAGLVLALALLATWLPARRAGRVDPATVLSAE